MVEDIKYILNYLFIEFTENLNGINIHMFEHPLICWDKDLFLMLGLYYKNDKVYIETKKINNLYYLFMSYDFMLSKAKEVFDL
jgi:hypothetical protein